MLRLLGLVAMVLLWAAPASAQSTRVWRITTASAITAHGLDLGTSMYCMGAQTCHEANRGLAWAQDQPMLFSTVKMGTAAGLQLLSWKLHQWKRGSRWYKDPAVWFNLTQTGVFAAIARRNTQQ